MSELRRDALEDRWVIVAPDRARRPRVAGLPPLRENPSPESCPFCPGQESQTRPEIVVRRENDAPDSPWRVRVVPNYYPMLEIEGDPTPRPDGVHESRSGVGAHEVIIETARHDAELADLPVDEIAEVVRAWRDRVSDLHQDPRLRQVVIFKNRGGWAGATIEHAHSQLAGLPMIPARLERRLQSMRSHYEGESQDLVQALVHRERTSGQRIVRDASDLVTWAPYASAHPFELMIAPATGPRRFTSLSDEDCVPVAAAIQDAILRLRHAVGEPPYNLFLHVEPNHDPAMDSLEQWFQWHLSLIPRLAPPAGFEWGSEVHINSIPPEEAAAHLRSVNLDG